MTDFWKDRRVLITGISGFIGSAVGRHLRDHGASIVGLIKDVNHLNAPFYPDLVIGDIGNIDVLRHAISSYEIDVIYHFAAYAIVRVSARDPLSTYAVNVMGTVNLLEAARQVGRCSSIVVASSDKAYGDHEILPYVESFPLLPKNTYDTSKACMDLIAQSYAHNYDMSVTVTRCSNVYGPGDPNMSRIIPNTIRRIADGKPPILYSDIENMQREFIYIDDVVDAYELLGRSGRTASGVYNVGGTGPTRIRDLVDTISDLMGSNLTPEIVQREPIFKEIAKQYIDASKLQSLGWSPGYDLRSGLEKTVEAYR